MPGPVQQSGAQYVRLDTDFGYDALGGIGRLGSHAMEVLPPGTRQTDRIPGPPRTVGRWFAKLLDNITPHSWRAQGKFQRGLEDFSAQTGRVLGHLRNMTWAKNFPADSPERRAVMGDLLKELAGLRGAAEPMTSRGADYAETLQARLTRNFAILREESPEAMAELERLECDGTLDELIGSLDSATQVEMAEDLGRIRDALHVRPETMAARVEAREAELEAASAPEAAPEPPYTSRWSLDGLRTALFEHCTLRGCAERELRGRLAGLGNLAEGAERALQATQEALRKVLDNAGISADPESFAQVREHVNEQMGRAVSCATDEVCAFALPYLKRGETAGRDGVDYARATSGQVADELAVLERAVAEKSGVDLAAVKASVSGSGSAPADPFQAGIQSARAQIRGLSAMYGEMISGLEELENRTVRMRLCVMLRELAESTPPEGVSRQQLGESCDALVDALRSPVPGDAEARACLSRLEDWMGRESVPEGQRARFMEQLPELRHRLMPDAEGVRYALDTTRADARIGQLESSRAMLERSEALHQAIGDAGALLQRSGLPQADRLIGQALELSSLMQKLNEPGWGTGEERQRAQAELGHRLSRLMAGLAQARMQAVNGNAQSESPAKSLNPEAALDALNHFQKAARLLVDNFSPQQSTGVSAALNLAWSQGEDAVKRAEEAATALSALPQGKQEKAVLEQLAVCAGSGRKDGDAALRGLLKEKVWNSGKHEQAAGAVLRFLDALAPVTAGRGQDELLLFLENRMGEFRIAPQDVYSGMDGNLHMLINTDRQTLLGKPKDVQGARWITLPDPESLPAGKASISGTGAKRLDELLSVEKNRQSFYPNFHRLLTMYLAGTPYDLSLQDAE